MSHLAISEHRCGRRKPPPLNGLLSAGRDWTYRFPPVVPGDAFLHIGPISHASGYLLVPAFLSGARNAQRDVTAYEANPLGAQELSLIEVEHWSPAEDWSDWVDAAR